MSRAQAGGIVGVFAHHDALVETLRSARKSGIEVRDVYTPVPSHEVQEIMDSTRSPVRFVTFAGGIAGLASGIALAEWSSLEWNLVVGGKPVTSIVPFMVVGFELTILVGALATLMALLFFSRLPARAFPEGGFRPEFTRDRYGLWLAPSSGRLEEARTLLDVGGAVEVHMIGDVGGGP